MAVEFSADYRTVRDSQGTTLCLSPVQGRILQFLAERGRPCSHEEIREAMHDAGYATQALRQAFYAADGRRVWGALIKPAETSRDHLLLDLGFVAKAPRPRRHRPRERTAPRKEKMGDRLRSLFRQAESG